MLLSVVVTADSEAKGTLVLAALFLVIFSLPRCFFFFLTNSCSKMLLRIMTVLHSMASALAEKRYMYARVYKKGSTYAYAN